MISDDLAALAMTTLWSAFVEVIVKAKDVIMEASNTAT